MMFRLRWRDLARMVMWPVIVVVLAAIALVAFALAR